jgi:uncharacterized protein (DUF488 family)
VTRVMAAVTFTIGYERKTLDEFLSVLVEARVDRVVDVRALPLSRRRSFSKTPLGEALAARSIEYVYVYRGSTLPAGPATRRAGSLDLARVAAFVR